jgi:hypothetical protein
MKIPSSLDLSTFVNKGNEIRVLTYQRDQSIERGYLQVRERLKY